MNTPEQWKRNPEDITGTDPLGLGQLEQIEPEFDGWDDIEHALNAHKEQKRKWRRNSGWMAVAASLVLVVSFNLNRAPSSTNFPGAATPDTNSASVAVEDNAMEENINALIGLSQNMEEQVKSLREETGSMPAESAIYVAELEDLIAQVDNELSLNPDSVTLWGHRVNLLLDLAQIYQQQWEIDYGRMASL